MTRNELTKILEQFAICAIDTATDKSLTAEQQYQLIEIGIEMVAETVMVCTKRKLPCPSVN
jgi:hypothetical protein